MDDQAKSSTRQAIVIYALLAALVLGVCLSVTVAPSPGRKGRGPHPCIGAGQRERPTLPPLPPCK
jgi:hypothetical protein